jgi:hypothetical protein
MGIVPALRRRTERGVGPGRAAAAQSPSTRSGGVTRTRACRWNLVCYQYGYDKASNRTSQVIAGIEAFSPGTTTYGDNEVNQLKTRTTGTRTSTHLFDLTGNDSGQVMQSNSRDQTTKVGASTFSYFGGGQALRVSGGGCTTQFGVLGRMDRHGPNGSQVSTPAVRTASCCLCAGAARVTTSSATRSGRSPACFKAPAHSRARTSTTRTATRPRTPPTSPARLRRTSASPAAPRVSRALYHFRQRYYQPIVGRRIQPFESSP